MEPPDGDVMLKIGLLPRSQEHFVKVAQKIMEQSVLSDVPLLQNNGEIVGSTANRQLYVSTKNDDWPVSVRRDVCSSARSTCRRWVSRVSRSLSRRRMRRLYRGIAD